ncbi:allantoinase AllB [Candidatus Sumerlaeota bacterium]|nr:allantoinase AllB [Candidatus Sumerlaeota bacterium]
MESLFRSTCIITPSGVVDGAVHVRDGMIVAVHDTSEIACGIPSEDFGGLAILPGLVDPHVHINDPGRSDWEGFETATRAAAAGGITTLIDMPLNSSPVTTTLSALHAKHEAAKGKLSVDVGFHGGLIPGNSGQIQALAGAGVFGIKAFLVHSGIDEFPNATMVDLREAMPILQRLNLPLLVHAELDEATLPSRDGRTDHGAWSASRPQSMEVRAIDMLLRLHEEFPCPLHIVHLAASDGIAPLREMRTRWKNITVETCPHYLFFSESMVPPNNTLFKCAPPIRDEQNKKRLWEGLEKGDIDMIASDHSPCPPGMKALDTGDFFRAWGGISSLQFGLPILWSASVGLALSDVARWMSSTPARVFGLGDRGAIAPGYRADFAVFDPRGTTFVEPSMIQHRHKLTPYAGRKLQGRVVRTYLQGTLVFDDGKFPGPLSGRAISRSQS